MSEFSVSEANWRHVAAHQTANKFLIEFLLKSILTLMTPAQIADVCEGLRKAARKTDQFEGVEKGNDFRAEQLADLVIRAQQIVIEMVDEAERSAVATSGSR